MPTEQTKRDELKEAAQELTTNWVRGYDEPGNALNLIWPAAVDTYDDEIGERVDRLFQEYPPRKRGYPADEQIGAIVGPIWETIDRASPDRIDLYWRHYVAQRAVEDWQLDDPDIPAEAIRQETDTYRSTLTGHLEQLWDRFEYGNDPSVELAILDPVIEDAAGDPDEFKQQIAEAFESEDADYLQAQLDELEGQIKNATASQIAGYWESLTTEPEPEPDPDAEKLKQLRSTLTGQLERVEMDFDYADTDPAPNIAKLDPVIVDLPDPEAFSEELDQAFESRDRAELMRLLGQLRTSIDTAPRKHLEQWIDESLGYWHR
jgi:hypothetical protein